MNSSRSSSRLFIRAGCVLVLTALACMALRARGPSVSPAPALLAPSAAAAGSPAGFVCRSAHFTLTAEVHAGS